MIQKILFFMLFLSFIKCKTSTDSNDHAEKELFEQKVDSIYNSVQTAKLAVSNVLKKDIVGIHSNIYILLERKSYTKEELKSLIEIAKTKHFLSKNCTIDFWIDKESFKIYDKYKNTDIPDKSYIKVAEANIATYYGNVDELILYSLIDSKYKELGGKLTKERNN